MLGHLHRWYEAVRAHRQALRADPDYPDAHYNLGIIYRTQQKFEQAADAFRSTLAVDSTFVAAQRQLDLLAPKLAV
ncbi:MAG: tetratricopeptide repeat protein, partial [Candidatus Rokubacteria bacterium]|nr:tetratricopeptide repeat protein [Candidatus Rokubacteria bacterium]